MFGNRMVGMTAEILQAQATKNATAMRTLGERPAIVQEDTLEQSATLTIGAFFQVLYAAFCSLLQCLQKQWRTVVLPGRSLCTGLGLENRVLVDVVLDDEQDLPAG